MLNAACCAAQTAKPLIDVGFSFGLLALSASSGHKSASEFARARLGICSPYSPVAPLLTTPMAGCATNVGTGQRTPIFGTCAITGPRKKAIRHELLKSAYRFDALLRLTKANGETINVWSSRDALVLKALAIVLRDHLPVSKHCTHVKTMAARRQR